MTPQSRWTDSAPKSVDLTLSEQDAWVRDVAGEMRASCSQLDTPAALESLEALEARLADAPVLTRLAVKLARSKTMLAALPASVRVSVVFAVYKEHNRLRTRAEHPHGEDLLVRKVSQLQWLFEPSAEASSPRWQLLVVDDGCPESSGTIAQQIIDANGLQNVRVLFLQHAIDSGHAAAVGLRSTGDSQKGGSIQYGMAVASQDAEPEHVVVFTDADLSTHLGQLGLLMHPIVGGGRDVAIGSRREPTSVVIKSGARNTRGKLFIYLWKRLLPQLSPIIDTQCGFKAFRASTAAAVVKDSIEKRFAFDIELLLRAQLARAGSIERAAIAWVDSEAASTTKDIQPYLSMLQSIVRISRHYLDDTSGAAAFAELIDSLDEASWERLSTHVPAAIADREPLEFEAFDGVSAAELAGMAQGDHRRAR